MRPPPSSASGVRPGRGPGATHRPNGPSRFCRTPRPPEHRERPCGGSRAVGRAGLRWRHNGTGPDPDSLPPGIRAVHAAARSVLRSATSGPDELRRTRRSTWPAAGRRARTIERPSQRLVCEPRDEFAPEGRPAAATPWQVWPNVRVQASDSIVIDANHHMIWIISGCFAGSRVLPLTATRRDPACVIRLSPRPPRQRSFRLSRSLSPNIRGITVTRTMP